MKVNFKKPENGNKDNDALLDYEIIDSKDKNTLEIWHHNADDGYYSYGFEVTGTDEEIKVIKEFCDKITEAK
jgi:hypothetical protein